jgi:hypothetical protein
VNLEALMFKAMVQLAVFLGVVCSVWVSEAAAVKCTTKHESHSYQNYTTPEDIAQTVERPKDYPIVTGGGCSVGKVIAPVAAPSKGTTKPLLFSSQPLITSDETVGWRCEWQAPAAPATFAVTAYVIACLR